MKPALLIKVTRAPSKKVSLVGQGEAVRVGDSVGGGVSVVVEVGGITLVGDGVGEELGVVEDNFSVSAGVSSILWMVGSMVSCSIGPHPTSRRRTIAKVRLNID
jgi:hypothetical protein